ncbi:TPA: hypothetical protein QDB06_000834 [Burkholderia vietnamiensis]|nr:hypothetical protein [Burkholderia vietnamiensis]
MFRNKKELDIEFFKTDQSTIYSDKIEFFSEKPDKEPRFVETFRTIGRSLSRLTGYALAVQILMVIAEFATYLFGYDAGRESIKDVEREWGFFIVGPLLQIFLVYTVSFVLCGKIRSLVHKYRGIKEQTEED